ncbi:uncharacterized protein LY79DRAFT_242920 [Colletotrichum navitas]|uniref:Uncharacterized protein n=1 Tax=Colletotrichum navitas TaxID=681940 RepID=A0AAD8PXP8_9PEZI|nr:uncharacterized protein LY79DRAFT_242920 [Colletotrichum navitas]KAK1585974.1 hypothetical protein LY79DRAFT_242920 [Colletotrichum navitas]
MLCFLPVTSGIVGSWRLVSPGKDSLGVGLSLSCPVRSKPSPQKYLACSLGRKQLSPHLRRSRASPSDGSQNADTVAASAGLMRSVAPCYEHGNNQSIAWLPSNSDNRPQSLAVDAEWQGTRPIRRPRENEVKTGDLPRLSKTAKSLGIVCARMLRCWHGT